MNQDFRSLNEAIPCNVSQILRVTTVIDCGLDHTVDLSTLSGESYVRCVYNTDELTDQVVIQPNTKWNVFNTQTFNRAVDREDIRLPQDSAWVEVQSAVYGLPAAPAGYHWTVGRVVNGFVSYETRPSDGGTYQLITISLASIFDWSESNSEAFDRSCDLISNVTFIFKLVQD